MPARLSMLVASLVVLLTGITHAAWEPVLPMEWYDVKPQDFTDRELEIPYLLHHFHTVANAVVEEGDTRGFLNIAVARNPEDNKPHNARIMENHLALAYFYTVDRPWNRYRGSDAVRQRLEAMLEYWLKLHSAEGHLPEYSADAYNLAATSFGVMFMSQTLELLTNGGPTIDKGLLERVEAAQRKSILAILRDKKLIDLARTYSNQYGGVYPAAMSYLLRHQDDGELMTALRSAAEKNTPQFQSPAGFLYEAGGPDAGYSGVYDMVLRLSADYLRNPQFNFLRDAIDGEMKTYDTWLSYNLLLQPDGKSYLVNAGPLTRTSMWRFAPNNRPHAERVAVSRAFCTTQAEFDRQTADRRAKLARDLGKWPPLKLPNAWAYQPVSFLDALHNLTPYCPTEEVRAAAIAKLPYIATADFNYQAIDPRPMVFTFAKRETYYAAFTSGKIRQPAQQNFGMGIVWNPKLGGVMVSIAGTDLAWGTRAGSSDKPYEKGADVPTEISLNDNAWNPIAGTHQMGSGRLVMTYPIGPGKKTVTFDSNSIEVLIEHPGEFTEQLPLVCRQAESFATSAGEIKLTRDGVTFTIGFDPGATAELRPPTKANDGLVNVLATLKATDRLKYTMRFGL